MLKKPPTLKERLTQFVSAEHSGEVMASQPKGAERLRNPKTPNTQARPDRKEALAAMRASPRIHGVPATEVEKLITQDRR